MISTTTVPILLNDEFQLYISKGVPIQFAGAMCGLYAVSKFTPRYRDLDEFQRYSKSPRELIDYSLILILAGRADTARLKLLEAAEKELSNPVQREFDFLFARNSDKKPLQFLANDLYQMLYRSFHIVPKTINSSIPQLDKIRNENGNPPLSTYIAPFQQKRA